MASAHYIIYNGVSYTPSVNIPAKVKGLVLTSDSRNTSATALKINVDLYGATQGITFTAQITLGPTYDSLVLPCKVTRISNVTGSVSSTYLLVTPINSYDGDSSS